MQLLIGFLIGLASSAVVAFVVYRRQRHEQLQAEATLLQRLAEHGDLIGIAAATGLVAAGVTGRLERDVSILRRQVMTALDARETVQDRHIHVVERLLGGDGVLDVRLLSALHRVLLAHELDYAGEYRDVAVRIGGVVLAQPSDTLRPPSPSELPERVRSLLEEWAHVVKTMPDLPAEQRLNHIVKFHADFLKVHPFFDGNGLLARALFAVHTERYLGQQVLLPRRDDTYFAALRRAFSGDGGELVSYVKRTLERAAQQGVEADEAR